MMTNISKYCPSWLHLLLAFDKSGHFCKKGIVAEKIDCGPLLVQVHRTACKQHA